MGVTLSPTCSEPGGGVSSAPCAVSKVPAGRALSSQRQDALCLNAWMLSHGASFTPAEAEKLDKAAYLLSCRGRAIGELHSQESSLTGNSNQIELPTELTGQKRSSAWFCK